MFTTACAGTALSYRGACHMGLVDHWLLMTCFTSSSSHLTFTPPTPSYSRSQLPSSASRPAHRLCTFPKITEQTKLTKIMEQWTLRLVMLQTITSYSSLGQHPPCMTRTSLLMRLARREKQKRRKRRKKEKETAPIPPLRHSCDS